MIKNRPELAPHFILNLESQYELGPGGEDSQMRNSQFDDEEQRETFQIMANINFKNLEKQ